MRQKATKILVRCTRGVANEMARYDCARIVGEKLVDNRFDAVVDKRAEKWGFNNDEIREEKERHRVYEFTLESLHHTVARWRSFGVQPVEVS